MVVPLVVGLGEAAAAAGREQAEESVRILRSRAVACGDFRAGFCDPAQWSRNASIARQPESELCRASMRRP